MDSVPRSGFRLSLASHEAKVIPGPLRMRGPRVPFAQDGPSTAAPIRLPLRANIGKESHYVFRQFIWLDIFPLDQATGD